MEGLSLQIRLPLPEAKEPAVYPWMPASAACTPIDPNANALSAPVDVGEYRIWLDALSCPACWLAQVFTNGIDSYISPMPVAAAYAIPPTGKFRTAVE